MNETKAVVKVVSGLTNREEAAYRMHCKAFKDGQEPFLSPILQAEMFELFLSGQSCEEIARLNKGIRLGQIVRACIEGDWVERRRDYAQHIALTIRENVMMAQAATAQAAAVMLQGMSRRLVEPWLRYMQTGDVEELGSMKNWSLREYKALAEMLLKVSGQDGQKNISLFVEGKMSHQGKVDAKVQHTHELQGALPDKLDSNTASMLLHALAGVTMPPEDVK